MVHKVPDSMTIFAGNANPELAKAVANSLNIPLGHATVSRFSDGEVMVQLLDSVRVATFSFFRAPALRRTTTSWN